MTIDEKINYMKIMGSLQVEEDNTLMVYLNLAKEKILNHIYPYERKSVEIDPRYDMQHIELAIVLFNQRGAEGEKSHNENGVSRTYRTENEILNSIPRYVGIPK